MTRMAHLDPWHPDIECWTFDIERKIRYRILRYRMLIDIDVFFNWYRILISNMFDIEGHIPSISKVTKGQLDIEVSYLRYRLKFFRYSIMISYTISKAFLTFDIEGHYRGRYRIRYSIHPMSFTAERKLPLPRRLHAGAEGSQHHEPWISCTLFLRNSTAWSTEIWRGNETSFHISKVGSAYSAYFFKDYIFCIFCIFFTYFAYFC